MIELIATVESIQQAKDLLEAGVDTIYFRGRPIWASSSDVVYT